MNDMERLTRRAMLHPATYNLSSDEMRGVVTEVLREMKVLSGDMVKQQYHGPVTSWTRTIDNILAEDGG